MEKICKGCGARLQNDDPNVLGYTPKMENDYCKRCFRIRHYDDVVIEMKQGIDSSAVLQEVAKLDALVLWVVDLFDFEANMVKGMNRHLAGKDIVMVLTKRDLLPVTLSNDKLGRFVLNRLRQLGIHVSAIVVCGDLVKHAFADGNDSVKSVLEAIAHYRNDQNVVVLGMANAGKSTLLNALLHSEHLTTSLHPGTTLGINPIDMGDYTLYDTPGLTRMDSYLTHVLEEDLKTIVPLSPLKARVFQLKDAQSFAVGGYCRLDMSGFERCSLVAYFSQRLEVHRGKLEKADALWDKHLGELLSPTIIDSFTKMKCYSYHHQGGKLDIVIHGLGWFCVNQAVSEIKVWVPEGIAVTFREAIL